MCSLSTPHLAAHRKQLTVGQASALCDLYEAQYDLVRAAWEVFCVQGNDPTISHYCIALDYYILVLYLSIIYIFLVLTHRMTYILSRLLNRGHPRFRRYVISYCA